MGFGKWVKSLTRTEVQNQVPQEQRDLWAAQTQALKPYMEMSEKVPGMINEDLISRYRDTLKQSPEESSLASTLQGYSERAGKPFDYNAYLEPLQKEWEQTIAPDIRSSALRVGAPGGSGEQESFARAGERYSKSAVSAFARARETENQSLGLAGALAQDAAQGGELSRALAQASVLAPLTLTQMGLGMQPASPQFTSLGTKSTGSFIEGMKGLGEIGESGASIAAILSMI